MGSDDRAVLWILLAFWLSLVTTMYLVVRLKHQEDACKVLSDGDSLCSALGMVFNPLLR